MAAPSSEISNQFLKELVNLKNMLSYTLTATAKNSADQAMGSITLNWGCRPLEENQ